jgi:hypothetical protein
MAESSWVAPTTICCARPWASRPRPAPKASIAAVSSAVRVTQLSLKPWRIAA